MKPNPGRCPPEAAGRRVRVVLRNGTGFAAPASGSPGRGCPPLDWTLDLGGFAVAEWEIAA